MKQTIKYPVESQLEHVLFNTLQKELNKTKSMAFYSKVSPCFFSILPMSPTFQTSAFDENETDGSV